MDRLATAWLVKRLVDPSARFRWLADPKKCPKTALGFDFDGARFTHVGDKVTFEVVAHSFDLEQDDAVKRLGDLVHYVDIGGIAVDVGDLCSFDAFLSKYGLADPALHQLAVIVRGADTSRLELTPQSAGLYALSLGLSENFAGDHEMLEHGMVMYDALYAWCKSCQAETHNWPPKMS